MLNGGARLRILFLVLFSFRSKSDEGRVKLSSGSVLQGGLVERGLVLCNANILMQKQEREHNLFAPSRKNIFVDRRGQRLTTILALQIANYTAQKQVLVKVANASTKIRVL